MWHFDEYGNPIYSNKQNDLPLEFRKDGELYIKIKNFNFEQDNILSMECYCFYIYLFNQNQETIKKSCTNNFAYTDIKDCLDKAIDLIKNHKQELKDYLENSQVIQNDLIVDINGTINPEI